MLYLYFIRHAQTEWNVAGKVQGRRDSGLTEKGVEDARLLGEKFKEIDWQAVYTSPSKRAVRTLELIHGESFSSYTVDGRLIEMDLGDLEGKTMEEIKELYPEQYHHYWHQPSKYVHTSGENFYEVKDRVEALVKELLSTYESGHVCIITHGVVVKMVQLIFRQLDMDQLWKTPYIEGTSVTALKRAGSQIEILSEGDLSHLSLKNPTVQ
ncbi:histidine phosphatase family protein [Siminovitchia sp. FSL H7-0308]|uniref:Phosphoglycerate mutase n=1 Tax=Siminovitchia thermophila TaxID=1245522 RepID=A0ABS2R9C4_9BACI|nr:histidine phosphatase family protein [Siminovitchia thermophila]MBM7715789.1 putative phosphoglycerate mutase [Siminovitchia thermophila]ONK23551.1 hypothetical protein BLX87_10025 [Bacillus sp. VT-16-64]